MRLLPLFVIAAGALALAGCPKKPSTVPTASDGSVAAQPGSGSGIGSGGVGDARALPGAGAGGMGAMAGPAGVATVIYFDFDRSDIRAEFAPVISAQARFLSGNPAARVRLEGHTDERGTREYNIALAERRSQAVRRALLLQGATDGQLTTVSYGEERPAVDGSDESAYSRNRRVELAYGR